jgi:phosphoribosylamine--glycine ligase
VEKVGIVIISYGAREAAMIDTFQESLEYRPEIYVVDKQNNPFNVKRAKEHVIISDFDNNKILKFVSRRRDKIDFGIVGPEKPIINGLRDLIEGNTGIPIICPTQKYALEASKVAQRELFEKTVPYANPRYKIFDPAEYKTTLTLKKAVYSWLDELSDQAVVKPDVPAAGKGVGVWGDHFTSRQQLFDHFLSNYRYGKVIIEEKLDGEESSFQVLCDGKSIIPMPDVRDYKRAFDEDRGPNTGGMGSYKDRRDLLPFMFSQDREKEVEIVQHIFKTLQNQNGGNQLRGVPFYVAFIHTSEGPKILENNSRPGDPEIINLLPLLKDDFINICFKIIEGNLLAVHFEKKASVVTYKIPPSYGGYADAFPQNVDYEQIGKSLNLKDAEKLEKEAGGKIRIYPASMELRENGTFALKSRTVAVLGIADTINEARELSLKGIDAIKGGSLWNRKDIASMQHIKSSIDHMIELRLRSQ